MLDSQNTTMKQNVRFQEGPCPEKNPDRIQNGWLSAIICTNMANMHNIWQTMVVFYTITLKQIEVILDWRFASTRKVLFLVELVCCFSDFPSDYLKSKKKYLRCDCVSSQGTAG